MSSWVEKENRRLEATSKAYHQLQAGKKSDRGDLILPDDFVVQADLIVKPRCGRRQIRPKPEFFTKQPDTPKLLRERTVVLFHTSDEPGLEQAEPISPPDADWFGVPKLSKRALRRVAPSSLVRQVNNAQRRHRSRTP